MPRRNLFEKWTRAHGKLLEQILTELALSIPAAAKKWNIAENTVRNWIAASSAPSLEDLRRNLEKSGYRAFNSLQEFQEHLLDRILCDDELCVLLSEQSDPAERSDSDTLPPLEDLKVLIFDPTVSRRILARDNPSLLECVKTTMSKLLELKEKFRIQFPEVGCNHFVAPSAIFRLTWPLMDDRQLLAYPRKPVPQTLQHEITRGLSCLWNASYRFRQPRGSHPSSWPMDIWIELAEQDPAAARTSFTDKGIPVLFHLLGYKLDPNEILKRTKEFSIRPLGVVTNDLRNEVRGVSTMNAVYTQYVFEVRLSLKAEPRKSTLLYFVDSKDPNMSPTRLPTTITIDPSKTFSVQDTGKENPMDIVAFRALSENESTITHQNATFVRGFEIV